MTALSRVLAHSGRPNLRAKLSRLLTGIDPVSNTDAIMSQRSFQHDDGALRLSAEAAKVQLNLRETLHVVAWPLRDPIQVIMPDILVDNLEDSMQVNRHLRAADNNDTTRVAPVILLDEHPIPDNHGSMSHHQEAV